MDFLPTASISEGLDEFLYSHSASKKVAFTSADEQ